MVEYNKSEGLIEEKFEKAFSQIGAVQTIFPYQAKRQMAELCEIIMKSDAIFDKILSTNQSTAVKGGFAAEQYLAETFNLDAVIKNDGARAYTDNYSEWYDHSFNEIPLKKNDIPDVIVSRDGKVTTTVQSKFYDTAENTAQQMSQMKDGQPKYKDITTLLGPKDQIDGKMIFDPFENTEISTTTIKEHANAKAEALSLKPCNDVEVNAYRQTAQKASAKIQDGKVSSGTLTTEEDLQLGGGDKHKILGERTKAQNSSTVAQMRNAAIGAAAMSAVISGAVNTFQCIQLVKKGRISFQEATYKIISETVSSAADSAVKASANVGIQSMMVRYGSEKAIIEVLTKQGLKSVIRTNALTIGVISTVDAVKDLIRLGAGQISKSEFYERQGKNFLTTSAGVIGGSAGAAGVTAIASSLGVGATGLALPIATAIGGIAGGLIAGLAMDLAIRNGIEKPYINLVKNTHNLQKAIFELEQVSRNVFYTHVLFTKFIQENLRLDNELKIQMDRIDAAGSSAFESINRV